MSEQGRWEPVPDGEYQINGVVRAVVKGPLLQLWHNLICLVAIGFTGTDNIRLCRWQPYVPQDKPGEPVQQVQLSDEPFWKNLTKQNDLEKQYEILSGKEIYTSKQVAIHLARFAEAHIFNAADKYISELEECKGQQAQLPEDVRDAWEATEPYSNWLEADEWAQWITIDNRGEVLWWEEEPFVRGDVWVNDITSIARCDYVMPDATPVEIPLGVDWRTLKVKRPDAQPSEQEGQPPTE